ncbi:MAG: glutamine amidotransferase [Candidatus Parcubacteria bacterium]|nr:glutamine amidotransferase [Candidatus Paceibacterota bacterium]
MSSNYHVTHLYPDQMSIYGDYGNILTLKYFCERIGLNFIYQPIGIGQELPQITHLYFFGGGQDKEQMLIYPDLLTKQARIADDLLVKNIGMLAICGGYQALGSEFITGQNQAIPGLKILPVTTSAPNTNITSRAIGNLVVESEFFGTTLIGFENHSGQTYFVDSDIKCQPIGKVLVGYGNNMEQQLEGCIYGNIIGTYMHGPILPKNPEITKWLITRTASLDPQQLHKLQNLNTSLESKTRRELINHFTENLK